MNPQGRTYLIAILAGIIGFAMGAGWQYMSARNYSEQLEQVQDDLTFQRLEATLGAATVEAQRGGYELARQLVSEFYTGLQTAVESAPEERKATFTELLGTRDGMITALSRNATQTGSMLAQIFVRYRIAMGEPVGPEPTPAAPPVTTQ